ncbi:hypothetical protein A3G67_02770 [Candidatus Roizmanbacteria bacterium RIFCSPLOWO2_12_FULL_40_12]|uniref:Uncharacterized protein n=1 Tax=Candidatus Roizmanbacteria bacterium RIFCSPLOWO2_01_FULL_40_42 TaxID=1802066 RepID=A0A1F7J2M6_9BACT|nr:MAG: hypothetical protein A2779_00300 [Candidatus Roizmanbacteria bacterium RIFCSPHIGHO2_01_FULL_40_98]OGK27501.1 MAG: hypothetical protein A3C31_03455 [Candidatus Roizmanbacteria bacterium RIFCSPHIGHO2_02_FULL_40_53]OGK30257.1 MAG: hypothetical protein A2W49_00940 [Candidatus Roizmanbacteria bacterium RIFCSPHIGHO2_12_41_18]OGK37143.1 MAG: hypothetical protein A3E69_01655 [Candidatus Roizmanbacteria bacterium RIFCSPHIGHO2_12_FULL_40_130]OGK49863.1 MAG: hypothetical protein A3B50_03695 [Candi
MAEVRRAPVQPTLFDQDSTKGVFDRKVGGYVEKTPRGKVTQLPSPRIRELKGLIEEAIGKGKDPHELLKKVRHGNERTDSKGSSETSTRFDDEVEGIWKNLKPSERVGLGLIASAGGVFVGAAMVANLQF